MTLPDTEAAKTESYRVAAQSFGQHYGYDVTYMEELLEASPGAYAAFAAGMGMSSYAKAAPPELLAIAKLSAVLVEDCGPCLELGIKLAREAGVPDSVIRGVLKGGQGLSPELEEVRKYAHAVAANESMDPDLLPGLMEHYGREVIAELAVAIAGVRIYPTLKRALGHACSCSLMPALI